MQNGQHRWSRTDDLAALYFYLHGDGWLPFSPAELAERRGIKPGSMRMRIANFRAYAGDGRLGNIAKQSVDIFERYAGLPEKELRSLAFPELNPSAPIPRIDRP